MNGPEMTTCLVLRIMMFGDLFFLLFMLWNAIVSFVIMIDTDCGQNIVCYLRNGSFMSHSILILIKATRSTFVWRNLGFGCSDLHLTFISLISLTKQLFACDY